MSRELDRRHEGIDAFVGNVPAREDNDGLGGRRGSGLERTGVFTPQHGQVAAQPLIEKTAFLQAREAESTLRYPQAKRLHRPADAAADRPEVFQPVLASPKLVPVDHQTEGTHWLAEPSGEQREIRKGCGVDDVVLPPVSHEVPERPEPEDERWKNSPPTSNIQRHSRPDRGHPHTVHPYVDSSFPLAEREIGDVMAALDKPRRQIPVPALCSADCVWKETVVDDADPHDDGG
jgi:hypothetical protein